MLIINQQIYAHSVPRLIVMCIQLLSLVNYCINYILTTRCKIQQTEQLYDKAKQYQTEET